VELVEAQAALAEADRKRESSLADLKTETEVLNAQLEAERKAAHERDLDLEKEIKLHKEKFAKELARIQAQHDRDLKQRDVLQKNQEESFKYKLQYLELSQKDLKRERKLFQDKEGQYKRQLTQLGSENRELKAQLHQQVDLHEAYKQHVDSKEVARSSESSGWDIKRQALTSEHQLELKRATGSQSARIHQLEAELERVKAELEGSRTTVQQLQEQLGEDEEYKKPARRETKRESTRSEATPTPAVASTQSQPEPEPSSDAFKVEANVGGVEITGEASF
jgi:hypothetical protein